MKFKRIYIALITIIFICSFSVLTFAQTEGSEFNFDCKSEILIDYTTGTILHGENFNEKLPIASMTKIMSLCIIFDNIENNKISLEDKVLISDNAAKTEGSTVFLEANHKYAVSDLVKSIIIASANDACVAMAEYIAGTEKSFVELMNNKAKELYLENTNFVNCTGLPCKGHYSSALDVALMSKELLKHETYFNWSSIWMDELVHDDGRITGLTNTNKLVRFFDGCDGVKTGYTSEAKFCVSATLAKGNMRLISVIIGGETSQKRFDAARELINYGFANFELANLCSAEILENKIPLADGEEKFINVIPEKPIDLVLKKGDKENIECLINIPDIINAPINKGDVIGNMQFVLNGKVIKEVNLLASDNYNKATIRSIINKMINLW